MNFSKQMKIISSLFCFLIVMLMFVSGAKAQLTISMETEFDTVLQYEKMNAFVRIHNNTSIPFVIDSEDKSNKVGFRFFIEKGRNNEIMSKIKRGPIITNLKLMPGEKRELIIDISKWYDVRAMHGYLIRCEIDWNGRTAVSDKRMINIVSGIELTSVMQSVPWNPGIMRKYSLRYWARAKGEYLFLRVDDEYGRTNYGVVSIGRLLRIASPSINVASNGKITVVHQVDRDRFTHSVYMSLPSGLIFVDQNYSLPTGKPYPARRSSKTGFSRSKKPVK